MREAYMDQIDWLRPLYSHDRWARNSLFALVVVVIGLALPLPIGAPMVLIGTVVYLDYLITIVRFMKARDSEFKVNSLFIEPKTERFYSLYIEPRWWRFATPVAMHDINGEMRLSRPANPFAWDFFELFDEHGHFLGTIQEIDWNLTHADSGYDSPDNVQYFEEPAQREERLSWLARWRTEPGLLKAA